MTNKIKSVKSYRADIGSFEKELTGPFFLYQVKEYNSAGLITHDIEYKPNGLKELEINFEYDGQQRLVSKQTYYPLEDTLEKLVYVYGADGQKIKEENYFGEDLFETLHYNYDDKGNIISQARVDEEDGDIEKQESEFDAKARIVKQTSYTAGEIERIMEFEYDEAGLCIRETHTYPAKKTTETVAYSYNELGKKTTVITKDSDDDIIGYLEMEYDEKMNPVKQLNETSGFYNSKSISESIFDEQGRVLENEYFDVLNNFLMSKEIFEYDENGHIVAEEIFETNPMAGLKKIHYRLKLEYDFFAE